MVTPSGKSVPGLAPNTGGSVVPASAAFATGLLLAWRFHSSRIFSALIVLVLGQHALEFFSSGRTPMTGPGLTALEAISFLVLTSQNFAVCSALAETRVLPSAEKATVGM